MERVSVETKVLKRNDEFAAENRALFESRGLVVLNIWSAPGAGKTTMLERTLKDLEGRYRIGVIEGDIQTEIDADRIRSAGAPAYQINTNRCHLEANMIQEALAKFSVDALDVLIIENIGNMVCPASYDLGEHYRVMVYSSTEGAEKPKKYPKMFYRSDCVLLNKVDLVPYTNVSVEELRRNTLDVSPHAAVFPISCRTGEGFGAWTSWLTAAIEKQRESFHVPRGARQNP
jgi:hydrogenase nickel incorporation protein HypB